MSYLAKIISTSGAKMKFPNLRPNMAEKMETMSDLCLLNNIELCN